MRQTSANYSPFPIVRDVDFMISFCAADTNAKKSSTVIGTSDNGDAGGIRQTVNDIRDPSGKYLSLENCLWTLDGTYEVLPDTASVASVAEAAEAAEIGLWSHAVSGADGNFTSPPTIRYTFANPLTTLGWTVYFDTRAGQYASRVRITAYAADGTTVLDDGIYNNEENVLALQHYCEGYTAVEFAFLSTNEPNRRLRLTEVDFGLTKNYDRNSLGSASIIYGADILSRSLPSRELVFTFDNSDKQYNLLNPDGVYQHLQEGQTIEASIRIGGETVDMGTFYFTKADVSKSGIVPQITANDRILSLGGKTFDGGADVTMPLSDALRTVLGGYDLPVRLEGNAGETAVVLAIPAETTVRESVRLLAQAAMCTVFIDRGGVLTFTRLNVKEDEDGAITSDELYDYTGVTIAEPVGGVVLTVVNEYRTDENGKAERCTYRSGVDASTTAADAVISSFRNPCVAPENGSAVAAWLLAGLKMRKHYAVKNRCDPAVEIGDTLRIDDIFGNRENAVITGIDIDYDGTLTAVTKGVGK